jgi:hypothetical protein
MNEKNDSYVEKYELKEDQAKDIQHLTLMYKHALIHLGSQCVELFETLQNSHGLRKSLDTLQEQICKELDVPRSASQINWDLEKKTLEVVRKKSDQNSPQSE